MAFIDITEDFTNTKAITVFLDDRNDEVIAIDKTSGEVITSVKSGNVDETKEKVQLAIDDYNA